jgi:hypothetical protein
VATLVIVMLGEMIWLLLRQRVSWQTMWRTVHASLMIVGLAAGALLAATAATYPTPTAGAAAAAEQATSAAHLPYRA